VPLVGASVARVVSLAWVLASALVVGGCADAPVTSEGESKSNADPAAFDADTGGVEGLVLDDEAAPIVGVQLGIMELDMLTSSDSSGRFSFSRVTPGTYKVFANRLGYDTAGKTLTVRAGEVANLNFELRKLAIVEDTHFTLQERGLFGCGLSWRPAVLVYGIAACGIVSSQYDRFLINWDMKHETARWNTTVFEMKWDSTQVAGKGLEFIWEVCANCFSVRFASKAGESPLQVRADESRIQEVVKASKAGSTSSSCNDKNCKFISRVFSTPQAVGSSSPADVGITAQQPFDQYVTFFFGSGPTPEFTALPDQ
jgi:hypothetical protein